MRAALDREHLPNKNLDAQLSISASKRHGGITVMDLNCSCSIQLSQYIMYIDFKQKINNKNKNSRNSKNIRLRLYCTGDRHSIHGDHLANE